MEEMGEETSNIKLLSCAGGAECKKALTLLNVGRLQEDFVEGMMCPGGCLGGPSKLMAEREITKARASSPCIATDIWSNEPRTVLFA